MKISKNLVRNLYCERKNIALIKEYMSCSGLGLKESKDAVEAHYSSAKRIMELFSPFFENDTIKSKKTVTPNDQVKKVIVKGMITACNNWKDMGFANAIDACQIFLNNIKEHGWNRD